MEEYFKEVFSLCTVTPFLTYNLLRSSQIPADLGNEVAQTFFREKLQNRISTCSEVFYTAMKYHPHINSQGVSLYTKLKRILFCLYNMEKMANSYVLNSVSLDEKKWRLQR